MKKITGYIFGLFLILAVSGCSFGNKSSNNSNNDNQSGTNPFNISDARYSALTEMSYVQKGNNYRLKNVIERLKNGEDVYIAAIGGSVTEGQSTSDSNKNNIWKNGYFYQFCNKLETTYSNKNIHYVNAGLCGTPSSLGLIRYKTDVTDKLNHVPDLLIVEFAVNDGEDDQVTRAYEAIIRNALEADLKTAVVLLHAASTYGSSAPTKIEVGKHYDLQQVNILTAVTEALAKKDFAQTDYYVDTVHPTKNGHEFMADCLMNLIDKVDKDNKASSYKVPSDWTRTPAKALTNFTRVTGDDDNVKITKGGFTSTDANSQGYLSSGNAFPQNWYKAPSDSSDAFEMKIKCKALILSYKQQGSWLSEKFGKAEIYVDGNLKETVDGGAAGGWNNCNQLFLIDEATSGNHTIKIKMSAGDENKGFTILAMGYSTSLNSTPEKTEAQYNVEEITKYARLINSLASEYNMSAFVWDLLDMKDLPAEKNGAGYMWRKKLEILYPSYVNAIIDSYAKSTDKGNSGDDSKFEEEDSFTAVKNFKAGWNLSNTLDSHSYYPGQSSNGWIGKKSNAGPKTWETAWYEPETTQEIADFVLNAGFNSIRVPVTWVEHLDENDKVDEAWMARVKEVVNYFYNRGAYVIVNVHHDGGGTGWVKASKDSWDKYNGRFEKLWTQIAETFKDYDERLVFESMNEVLDEKNSWSTPSSEVQEYINKFNQLFVDTVRKTGGNNGKRNLAVMTYAGGSHFDGFKIPADSVKNHIIMEVHDYNPTPFCWSEKNVTWTKCTALWNGSVNVEKTIRDNLANYKTAAEKLGVPLIIGEYNASPKLYSNYD